MSGSNWVSAMPLPSTGLTVLAISLEAPFALSLTALSVFSLFSWLWKITVLLVLHCWHCFPEDAIEELTTGSGCLKSPSTHVGSVSVEVSSRMVLSESMKKRWKSTYQ